MTIIDETGILAASEFDSHYIRSRDLVFLMFRAVLRRDPEQADAAAFTNAVQAGMPIYDFVSELMSTPEFQATDASIEISSPPDPFTPATTIDGGTFEILNLSVSLLQARLVDKGCRIQFGPAVDVSADQGTNVARMERLMRTLALMDAL